MEDITPEEEWLDLWRSFGISRFGQGPLGRRFGRLLVIEDRGVMRFNKGNPRRGVLCRCVCGITITIAYSHLTSGQTRSCGCIVRERMSKLNLTHGATRTGGSVVDHKLYETLHGAIQRCHNSRDKAFKDYGGRGIRVWWFWRHSFPAFHDWALAQGYQPHSGGRNPFSLDRIDNDGNYTPYNCDFRDYRQQMRNRRSTRLLTAWNETKCMVEWSEDPRCQVCYITLHSRLRKGWSVETAVSTPPIPQAQRRRYTPDFAA